MTVAVSLISTVCKGAQLRVLLGVPLFAACIQVGVRLISGRNNEPAILTFQPTRLSERLISSP
jgi:hypothetical protein